MWDTRSIIVRFRRQRGNTCLPGEPKSNSKKVKEEPSDVNVKTEQSSCTNNQTSQNNQNNKTSKNVQQIIGTVSSRSESNSTTKNIDVRFSSDNSPITVIPTESSQQKQPWVNIY